MAVKGYLMSPGLLDQIGDTIRAVNTAPAGGNYVPARQYEGGAEYHAPDSHFRVVTFEASGRMYWRCTDSEYDDMRSSGIASGLPAAIAGNAWYGNSGTSAVYSLPEAVEPIVVGSGRYIYCDVVRNSAVLSGYIASQSGWSGLCNYSGSASYEFWRTPIAYVNQAVSGGPVQVLQFQTGDIVLASQMGGGGGGSGEFLDFPWKIRVSGVTAGGYLYSVQSGSVYMANASEEFISGISGSGNSASLSFFLNMRYNSGAFSGVVATSDYTQDQFLTSGMWSHKIGTITYSGAQGVVRILQTLSDYYDIRGRVIPQAYSGFKTGQLQALCHPSGGSVYPLWVDIQNCGSGV